MPRVVGIKFKPTGKTYSFNCGAFVLREDDRVIVETEDGLSVGRVAVEPVVMDESELRRPLKKVFRPANENDRERLEQKEKSEKKAFDFCIGCIEKLGLKMNLFSVEETFDGNKLTFFFTAEGRVDFRKLVKMLVKELCVKIEMRQVGSRHHAKMCSGMGRCGRMLCCSSFINDFVPVSIKMAKTQGLSLNPAKISGVCGRLMCCLTFEEKTYRELKKDFPAIGQRVETVHGPGRVLRVNVIGKRVTVKPDDGGEEMEIGMERVTKF